MKRKTDLSDNVLANLQESANSLALIKSSLGTPSRSAKMTARARAALSAPSTNTSKGARVAIDLGGGAVAQVSTELINWAIRSLGDWAGKDSWVKKNVDILQGAPHVMIGLAVYLTELLTRPKGKLPSLSREMASEAANVFSHLGFANLFRAMRIRWADGKVDATTLAKVTAERDAALAKLAAGGK